MNSVRNHPLARCHQQSGVTLIELLIGIAIGLLVVLAAIGSMTYTRVSSTTVGDSSRLHQDASTAFRILGHHIRQGGARRVRQPIPGSTNVMFNLDYSGYGLIPGTGNAIVVQGTDGAANGPDTLQVSHDGEPGLAVTDCIGEAPGNANNVQNRFFHQVNAQGVGELRCQGSGASSTAAAVNTFALIQGVEDIQVWYGIRTQAGLQYQTATQILALAPARWDLAESVQICLQLAGELQGNPTPDAVQIRGCNDQVIANDGRIRRTFFRVFNIRNLGL